MNDARRASPAGARPRLLFVSPRFLFPVDSGGKIRTTQILRGLQGGAFEVTLVSPAPDDGRARFASELAGVCERFVHWPASDAPAPLRWARRAASVVSHLPIPVASDRSAIGSRTVRAELDAGYDVVVFDFPHSAVLAPPTLGVPGVLFTHNVEAEIFDRHRKVATNAPARWLWSDQTRKMRRFERDCLRRFDAVVAVAERDARAFEQDAGVDNVSVIPTGVDLDFFACAPPAPDGGVVFTGSMDWLANIDGIQFLLDDVWAQVERRAPGLAMTVVGRAPPPALVERAGALYPRWSFTGFVDDIRPFVHAASMFVIPLRVGGGTRLKVYEAMAMGCPIVSTAIGVEGLPVRDGEHYLRADTPAEIADALARLREDPGLRERLSRGARRFVEQNFSFRAAAAVFESVCLAAMEAAPARPARAAVANG